MAAEGNRVVVTGIGVASVLGHDVETFWQNLLAGERGYCALANLRDRSLPFSIAGSMSTLGEQPAGLSSAVLNRYDRTTQIGLIAGARAACAAGLHPAVPRAAGDGPTAGVVMGTTCGANDVLEEVGFESTWFDGRPESCPDGSFSRYNHGALATALAEIFRFDGPTYVVGTACSSGNHAIGEAIDIIRAGEADIVVCGGADALTLLPIFGFYSMKSLASEKCQPFDRDREGMILAEGGAALVLESAESASRRRREPLAEVRGWALNCDARNFAAPIETGERCEALIRQVLNDANLDAADIDYINAHGTGTATNDQMEARGIQGVYGSDVESVPVSSIKGALGHTLGAAGAFEGVAAVLALRDNCAPPNAHVDELDVDARLSLVREPKRMPLNHVISLSFAFGGCNVATLYSTSTPSDRRQPGRPTLS